jgi:hypothetical protein
VTAVLELVRAGNVRPTAKEIARRDLAAPVYVHFEDLDDLFAPWHARPKRVPSAPSTPDCRSTSGSRPPSGSGRIGVLLPVVAG